MADKDIFLSEQIITYLGNKRSLIPFIETAVKEVQKGIGRDDVSTLDLFSGSGVVSRYFKTFSSKIISNDLESYSNRINRCYLINPDEYDSLELDRHYTNIQEYLQKNDLRSGFISELYSPRDDKHIQIGERVFYTTRNAKYIDTVRALLEDIPEPYKTLLLAPLLYEASVKTNTSGVFKGFYKNSSTGIGQFGGNGKNALSRIMADITLQKPILYDRKCEYSIYQEDANTLVSKIPHVDLAYLDPPYNQHPYSSNYFMLNLIESYKKPTDISEVSGIPSDWNKSVYNKRALALESLDKLCSNLDASYVLVSFSSDGFISFDDMVDALSKKGDLTIFEKKYNTFRACRNLSDRDIHVKEFLYLLKKKGV